MRQIRTSESLAAHNLNLAFYPDRSQKAQCEEEDDGRIQRVEDHSCLNNDGALVGKESLLRYLHCDDCSYEI